MAIEFPDSPIEGTQFTASNGVIYTYENGGWNGNSASGLEDVFVEISGDTMSGNLNVPSLNGGQLAGFRNQIINGNFEISQRGTGSFTNPKEYTLDRWRTRDNAGEAVNVSQMSVDVPGHPFALRYTATTGAVSGGVDTFIELPSGYTNGPFAPSSTWTLSYWSNTPLSNAIQAQISSAAEGTPNRATGGAVETLDTYNTFTKYSQTFTMPAAPFENTKGCLKVVFTTGALPADFILTGVQLEPGPVATPFEHRPIGTELALCQRYYYMQEEAAVGVGSNGIPVTFVKIFYSLPTTMRAQPTVTQTVASGSINSTFPQTTNVSFVCTGNANGDVLLIDVGHDAEL